MGNFFHLSMSVCAIRASFVAAGFEDNRSPNVITGGVLCHWGCYRDHVALVSPRVFRRTRAKFHGAAFRATTEKKGKKRKTDGKGGRPFSPTPQKESLEIPRHMLHGTSRLLTRPHSRNVRHPLSPSYPPSLFSSRCSQGEIQIYAPTAPGVFFELMKNESSRARPSATPPLPFLSSRGLPPPPPSLLFHLELGFPKPSLYYRR